MANPTLTYSHSLLIPLTRTCGAHCTYCTYKNNDMKLLTFDEIEALIRQSYNTGICETVLMAGQSLDGFPELASQWSDQGCASFMHYVKDVCRLIAEHRLLPSLDIGPLTYAELEMIRPHIASMTLMLENVNTGTMAPIQSGKSIDEKIESIGDAGLLGIPVTTGILFGVGESIDDGIATLDAIEELHKRYGHIQSIVFQPAVSGVPKEWSKAEMDAMDMMMKYSRTIMPELPISIPVNTSLPWLDLATTPDDIGHVYEGSDGLDPVRTFPKLSEIERQAAKKGYSFRARFPVFESMYRRLEPAEELQAAFGEWKVKREYASYN